MDQAEIAGRLGVAQNTVSDWLTTNIGADKGCKDNRVTVPKDERPDIWQAANFSSESVAAEGLSTREIAALTGSSKSSIARDLAVPDGTEIVPDGTDNDAESARLEPEAIAGTTAQKRKAGEDAHRTWHPAAPRGGAAGKSPITAPANRAGGNCTHLQIKT